MKRKHKILLASLSGLLLSLPWYSQFSGIIVSVAFVPLLLIEHFISESHHENKSSELFLYSSLSFLIWNILTTYWIVNSEIIAAIVVICTNTFVMSITFGLFHITKRKFGNKIGNFSLIVYWISFEYIFNHAHLTWPWLNLGNAFAGDIKLIQWYEYTGVMGGTLWVLILNLVLYNIIKRYLISKNLKVSTLNFLTFILFLIIPIIISLTIFRQYKETGKNVKIAVIQPNFDPYKEKYQIPQNIQLSTILNLAKEVIDEDINYVIAPETSLSKPIWENNLKSDLSIIRIKKFVTNHPKVSFIIGASTFKELEANKEFPAIARFDSINNCYYTAHNAALQIDTTNQIPVYYKSKLVSGVETIPLLPIFSFLKNITLDFGGIKGSLGIQNEREVFTHSNLKISIAPIICYESAFGEHVSVFIQNSTQIMCLITNDGWWGNTQGYKHHLSYAQLRAIETRRSIARSANTGISAFINQKGEIIKKTKWWKKDAIVCNLKPNKNITFYVEYGDYIGRIALLLSVLLILYTIVVSFTNKKTLI